MSTIVRSANPIGRRHTAPSTRARPAAAAAFRPARRGAVQTKAAARGEAAASAITAAAAAALLLTSGAGPLQASELPSLANTVNPAALVTEAQPSSSSGGGLLSKLLNVGKSRLPGPIKGDAFGAPGADRAQATEVADTKHPIAIITEQEAVAPEAFPNPSEAYSSTPPVLAAAESDEAGGDNANQFKGLKASDRQGLIDKKSPAQATAKAGARAAPVALELGQPATISSNPGPLLAEEGGSIFDKIKSALPKLPAVTEDPYGADRAQATEVADTERSIPIITEQEAVVTEAFPNPSEAYSPKPPVLAAAESDEHLGCNANQFEGVDASCRQGLIDAKSPAEATGTTGSAN